MKYFYYPGCSLEGTAKEYNLSTVSLMKALGTDLIEIEDWTCCGASAAHAVSELLSYVLPTRTLALAEKMSRERKEKLDILVPCSACYLNLKKVSHDISSAPGLLEKINAVLEIEGLVFENRLAVRHLLDILTRDIDIHDVLNRIQVPFKNFSIAPYYGCQCLRPFPVFDNPEKPESMEPFIRAAGASVHSWEMGGRCCGASHMTTKPEVGRMLVAKILTRAKWADMILTVCPMCQMNLEGFQKGISRASHEKMDITILYLPQFIGMAMGLPENQTRTDLNLCITPGFYDKYQAALKQLSDGITRSA